jgi:potassium/sodium efflux P-type ATPase
MVLAGHFWRNIAISDIVVAGIGVAVAAIPEGLPLIMTISLAIGVRRMAARNALVRRLPAVETLGSVTVICSDKTGTLTRSEMTVQQVSCAGVDFGVSGVGYAPRGEIAERASGNKMDRAPPALSALLESAVLCNDASLVRDEAGSDTWMARGNPTEAALLTLAHKGGVDFDKVRASRPRVAELPFDSGHQYMASLHHTDAGSIVLVKGAPERVLEMCRKKRKEGAVGARRRAGLQLTLDGGTERLSLSRWRDAIDGAARAGHRVLAFAQLELPATVHALTRDQVEHDLTFVGIVALMDPPRTEAIEAIAQCHEAGVRVVMITGDHGATASAIAQQIGLHNGDRFVLGSEVQEMSDDALRQSAAVTNVFARASPEHKLRLVQALQQNGEVVAMTGDGVNDAPALKQANIGVAMGLKGTEVAKQAAAIVLADDNFQSIAAAVEEGRGVYAKLLKAICYMLPVNVAEAGTFLVAILFGVPMPISAVQVLWINMIDSVILALGLAFDATSHDVMRRPPRSPKQRLLTRFVLWRIVFVATIFLCGVFGLYEWSRLSGDSPQVSSTVAANTLVSMITFYLLSVRLLHVSVLRLTREQIWRSVLAIGAVYALQAVFTYAPFMQALFGTRDLGGMAILLIGVVSLVSLAVIEIEKTVWRWWTQRKRHSEIPRFQV